MSTESQAIQGMICLINDLGVRHDVPQFVKDALFQDDRFKAAIDAVVVMPAPKRWRWLRQLICIHGPIRHIEYGGYATKRDNQYGHDFCVRCGKITCRYCIA